MVYHKEYDLSPIEVAIDEMQKKVAELQEVIAQETPDSKKLQLRLQGSISVQVGHLIILRIISLLKTETCWKQLQIFRIYK